jgi:acetyl-CoA carboxylase carboxyl transferase subunit alpha
MKAEIYSNLTPWQRVQLSRHPRRPYSLDYIARIFSDFEELHGDRRFNEDAAIVGGPAFFDGQPVMVLGQQKGRNTRENLKRNFGCPHPEGYRKALRLMKMAEKFGLPVITFIDTPGAYPGIGAEERHVAEAIAVNIRDMSTLEVPIISVVIGEGGSGGALGMAVADEVMILENGYYSVISPEGCAAILWKDRAAAPQAADALKFSPEYLKKFGVVDRVISEPLGGAHRDYEAAAEALKAAIDEALLKLKRKSLKRLLDDRYAKFRALGEYADSEQG